MMSAQTRAMLYTCPCCHAEGFTRFGLRQHWCAAAPKLGGQQTKSRPLTGDEWQDAVRRQDTQRTQRALQAIDQEVAGS